MEMKSWRAWEAEGTAKTNSKFQRHSWLAGLEPSRSLETEASLGLLVTQSFPCSAPSPRAKGSLVRPCPEGSRASAPPPTPRSSSYCQNLQNLTEVSLGKAFPDSPYHSTSSVSLLFCSIRHVRGGGVGRVRGGWCVFLVCVWHAYVVCVVCVWCVCGV